MIFCLVGHHRYTSITSILINIKTEDFTNYTIIAYAAILCILLRVIVQTLVKVKFRKHILTYFN